MSDSKTAGGKPDASDVDCHLVELVFATTGEDDNAVSEDRKLRLKRSLLITMPFFNAALKEDSYAEGQTNRVVIREVGIDVARVVLQADSDATLNGLTKANFLPVLRALGYFCSAAATDADWIRQAERKMVRCG
ncbi:unnamed protein product [Vitrella brassicaformis CCMP3155]|uniref:BTB domain-containing protein n=1 Tax=Vitrella brassicaformis (strain CCMP3155) TaxID=1169540 RepID=A0A0G4E884_VITBC|nr:unnamed protein product [Vitrella brassicaformis CCMP3155]|eukprot:CEL91805.1 unnamed protein product [Vitrella brassicaformis CCMP3155]